MDIPLSNFVAKTMTGALCTTDASSTERNHGNDRIKASCESDIHALKHQMNDLTKKYDELMEMMKRNKESNSCCLQRRLLSLHTTQSPTSTPVVAFSAALQHNINLGQDQVVDFDKVITNIGNGFDVRHSHFTAPVKGLYLFTASLFVAPGNVVHVDIVMTDKTVGYLYANGNDFDSTQTVIVSMKTGDMVWLKHRGDGIGHSVIEGRTGEHLNTFSGVLIHHMV